MVGNIRELVHRDREWTGGDWLVDVFRCIGSFWRLGDVTMRFYWMKVGKRELLV